MPNAHPTKRRRTRRTLGLIAIACLGAMGLALSVATRSAVLRAIVEPRLADALGAEVAIGRASFGGVSSLTLRDVVAVARGVQGEASRVLVVDRLDATLDWGAILSGRFGVREVSFENPTLRLSQRAGTATLNLANLTPSPGAGGPVELPAVVVRSGRVEFGEHDDASYTPLASIEVNGSLARSSRDPALYEIALLETEASAAARVPRNPVPITLEGQYDPLRVEGRLVLENVDLASWGPDAAPSDVRDLWSRLRLAGEVERTEFVYSDSDGVRAEFHFADVALQLPIAADPRADTELRPGPRAEPQRLMQVSDARGVAVLGASGLHAQVTGLIEDLAYRVTFDTTSLGLDAGFTIRFDTSEPFQIAERPQLLPFAPPVVRRRLDSFSSPTALMDASVVVTRAPTRDGATPPLSIAGVLDFSEGSASYADFPYPVRDMRARVRFDEESVVIEEMTGTAPTGATMRVQGVIAPPTDGAMVDLRIVFEDVPLDEAFDDAMPSSRAGLIDAIFNRAAEARLRAAGLLPDDFTVGGVGSLDIRVYRALGEDSNYDWNATFALARGGLLVEKFPLPAIIENAQITVNSDIAEVRIADVRGVSGGEGDLFATILLRRGEESVFIPTIAVRSQGTPIDDRLLAAIPGGIGCPEPDEGDAVAFNASEAVRALGLRGAANAITRVLPRDDGSLGFDVFLDFEGVSGAPDPARAPIVTDLEGRLSISESSLVFSGVRGRLDASPITLDGEIGIAGGAPGAIELRLGAESLEVSSPFESLLAPFSPGVAASIRSGIDAVALRGEVDARVALRSTGGGGAGELRALLDIPAVAWLELDALGERVAVREVAGSASIDATTRGPIIATFRDLTASASYAGGPAQRITLSGEFDATRWLNPEAAASPGPARELRVAGSPEWPSALSGALVRSFAPARADAIAGALDRWGVRLSSDASAVVRSGGDEDGGRPRVDEVVLTPRSLSLRRDEHSLDMTVERGRLVRRDDAVFLEDIALRGEGVSLLLRGRATLDDAPSLDVQISGEVLGLGEATLAFLPGASGDALRAASLRADRATIERAELTIASRIATTLLDSSIRFEGASFDLGGTDIAELDGVVSLQVDTSDVRPLDATLRFASARVQRLRLGAGSARVLAVDSGQSFLVPLFEAVAYGGRLVGFGKLTRGRADPITRARPLEYQVEGQFGGVSLQGLRDDLAVGDPSASSPSPNGVAPGQLDAMIGVAGVVGSPQTRVGRGAVRAWGGEVLRLPLLSRLIELSNLQLPTGEELDFAHARFYLEGDRVMFEELGVASDSVTLSGQGSLLWPSLNLDLRVTSRAARRAPVLSDIFEAFRDELVTTRVTGPITDPRFSVESLPTTRRFLDSIFGKRKDADEFTRPPARPIRPAPALDD